MIGVGFGAPLTFPVQTIASGSLAALLPTQLAAQQALVAADASQRILSRESLLSGGALRFVRTDPTLQAQRILSGANRIGLGGGGGTLGFLDVLNGIGQTVGTVISGTIGTIGTVAGAVAAGANAVNQLLNGNSGGFVGPSMGGQGPVWTMPPMMENASSAMVNGNTGASGQAAFEMACRADPACTAAVVQALQGMPMNGMMNGSTMASEDFQLASLGFPPALIMSLRAIPGAIQRILGSTAGQVAIGVGGAAIGGALAAGGMGMAMRLPRTIRVQDGRGGVREYVSRGRPILYSGDLSAMRRVKKVAQRVPRPRRARPRPLMISASTREVCGKCLTAPCACGGH